MISLSHCSIRIITLNSLSHIKSPKIRLSCLCVQTVLGYDSWVKPGWLEPQDNSNFSTFWILNRKHRSSPLMMTCAGFPHESFTQFIWHFHCSPLAFKKLMSLSKDIKQSPHFKYSSMRLVILVNFSQLIAWIIKEKPHGRFLVMHQKQRGAAKDNETREELTGACEHHTEKIFWESPTSQWKCIFIDNMIIWSHKYFTQRLLSGEQIYGSNHC